MVKVNGDKFNNLNIVRYILVMMKQLAIGITSIRILCLLEGERSNTEREWICVEGGMK